VIRRLRSNLGFIFNGVSMLFKRTTRPGKELEHAITRQISSSYSTAPSFSPRELSALPASISAKIKRFKTQNPT
jgi:hypothetical protein